MKRLKCATGLIAIVLVAACSTSTLKADEAETLIRDRFVELANQSGGPVQSFTKRENVKLVNLTNTSDDTASAEITFFYSHTPERIEHYKVNLRRENKNWKVVDLQSSEGGNVR